MTFVTPEAAGPGETFSTQRTRIRGLARVGPDVSLQLCRLPKPLVTHKTLVRTVSGVHDHVPLQAQTVAKGLVTRETSERFLARVHAAVLEQVARRRTALAADAALERFLVRVAAAHVLLQVLAAAAYLLALGALVATAMNIHVQIVRAARRETPVADRARVDDLRGGGVVVADRVDFQVRVEISLLAEGPVAHETPVGSVAGVGAGMPDQARRLRESLPAKFAAERSLAGVTAAVLRQVLGGAAALSARVAAISATVDVQMLAQGRRRSETLPTLAARVAVTSATAAGAVIQHGV